MFDKKLARVPFWLPLAVIFLFLGRVDEPDPLSDGGDLNEAQEA